MRMMSGFDARNIDIYEEDGFGPPPRFLVEGKRDHGSDPFPEADGCEEPQSPLDRLKALLNAMRW